MANPGLLGKADLAQNADANIYTVPAGNIATININFCNRNSYPVKVRLSLGVGGAPAGSDYLEWEAEIGSGINGVLERTGLVAGAGENLIVRSNFAGVSVRAMGFVEPA